MNANLGDISSQSKMRFNHSKVSISAAKNLENEFTVNTQSGVMNMKENFMDEVMKKKQNFG